MNNSNIQQSISTLEQIIQFGVGQNRTDGSFDIFIDKLSGKLPLGADAPTFTSRKRIICLGLRSKIVQFSSITFLCGCLSAIFALATWAFIPDLTLFIYALVSLMFAWGCMTAYRQSKNYYQILNAIKALQQTRPDPEVFHPVIDQQALDARFFKERQQARVIACFIIVVSSGCLFYIYQSSPKILFEISFLLPLMFMLGIGLFFCPISRKESLYLYGTAKLPWKHFPFFLKICCIFGGVFSIAMMLLYKVTLS
ncbi:hypothetical protein [uncultured Acinetobacter sp.]|uniref:hypothetical protein n=1 Tax=uncultured Acinetobacter sp. TaxID=165433 RepID=UPI0025DB9255|nr:hypothetical protein [uncultured Acinetobacter sp.]